MNSRMARCLLQAAPHNARIQMMRIQVARPKWGDDAANGRIYAILDDYTGTLDSDDFYGTAITAVTEII